MSKGFKRPGEKAGSAFAGWIGEHKVQLYRTAFSYLKNEQDALEAVQEVTYRAYTKRHAVKEKKYLKSWLIRIMINYCIDELRKRKRAQQMTDQAVNETAVSDPDVTEKLVIEQAVEQLPEDDQVIIVLKYYHQYTLTEIAESLDWPVGTVKTRLHRALKALRRRLKGREEFEK